MKCIKFVYFSKQLTFILLSFLCINVNANSNANTKDVDINITKSILKKIQIQAQSSNYKGTIVVQKQNANNLITRTFNVTHFYDGASEYEQIIPLEGNMRHILRINQIVQAYMENKK